MARRRRLGQRASRRLILDSGAVISLSRSEQRARAYVARAMELGVTVEVPVAVVAETLRGKRDDASVHRVLQAVGNVPDMREAHGRTAGRLLGVAHSSATVDALVVAQAIEAGGGRILTGDPDDLTRLARGYPEVRIKKL